MIRLAALILLLTASGLHGHALHQSTAEAEYNAETKRLEVSLTVFINDLELALIRHSEKLMSLEKTPAEDFDAQVQSYLAKTFVVTDAAGKASKIEWVGRVVDEGVAKSGDPTVTLFFTVPLAGGVAEAILCHAVLCDLFKDQANLLHLRDGSKKAELKFSVPNITKGLGGP